MSLLFILISAFLGGLLIVIYIYALRKINDDLNKKVALKFGHERKPNPAEEIQQLKTEIESIRLLSKQMEIYLAAKMEEEYIRSMHDTRLKDFRLEGHATIGRYELYPMAKSTKTSTKDLEVCL